MNQRKYRPRTSITETPDNHLIIAKAGGRFIAYVMTVGLFLVSVAALVMPVLAAVDVKMQRLVFLLVGVPVTVICASFVYRLWANYAILFDPVSGRLGYHSVFGTNRFSRRLGRVVNFECQDGAVGHDLGYSIYAVCEFGVKVVADEAHLDTARNLSRQLNDHVLLYENLNPTVQHARLELESRQLAVLRYMIAGGMLAIIVYVFLIVQVFS